MKSTFGRRGLVSTPAPWPLPARRRPVPPLCAQPTGDRLIVAGASNQPVVFDRDGRKLTTLMKGDMYIRDMRSTKGHVAACTAAAWHATDRATVSTSSEDGTVRLWDVEVAIERGDDALSLNVNGGQKQVAVLKDGRGIKTGCTCMQWHPEGRTLVQNGLYHHVDSIPSASLAHLKTLAAPTQPRSLPKQLGGLLWPRKLASGCP